MTNTNANTLIDINNLTVGYNSQTVLSNVKLTIGLTDFVGIIGPNGGGKTTLIKSILGLINIWNGSIAYNIDRSKIGYLPQINHFDKEFPISVFDVVLSGLAGKKGIWGRFTNNDYVNADKLLEQAGVYNLKNKPIGQLSGGQIQRVLLCRALINNPALLILDEPGTYVDSNFENELFEWLKHLNQKIAIIMVSHDLGIISTHVKSIACVNKTLHYHSSNKITAEQLKSYNCPIKLIAHGDVPHQVLLKH